jgi:hypothetical protein
MNAKQTAASSMGLRVSETVLAILGGIAVFLGAFILLAGDDQYVGLGGEASWRVGDIALAWGIGLLIVGLVVALLDAVLVRWDRGHAVSDVRATASTDFAVHAAVFVLVNAFVWLQDIAIGGGVNYAWWLTVPWGIGLAIHAYAAFAGEQRTIG